MLQSVQILGHIYHPGSHNHRLLARIAGSRNHLRPRVVRRGCGGKDDLRRVRRLKSASDLVGQLYLCGFHTQVLKALFELWEAAVLLAYQQRCDGSLCNSHTLGCPPEFWAANALPIPGVKYKSLGTSRLE
jgi:hypothetical protein